MSCSAPLVSVVVPVFNAEDTLAETLRSVEAQTHRDIEILIVDDGSTDGTATVAREFCREDQRARLIRQANAGVAAARNAGIAEAKGELVAPIDADDLWHPQKLERQVARFRDSPPEVGLVYNWSRIIDEASRIVAPSSSVVVEGDVFRRHLSWNFIGNGSTPMMRTALFRRFGYSPQLRDAGCQGCEDYLLQLQIASQFEFRCVPAFLTGYRLRPGGMSDDHRRMIRSHILMFEILRDCLPASCRHEIDRALTRQQAALALTDLRHGLGWRNYLKAFGNSPRAVAAETVSRMARGFSRGSRSDYPFGLPFMAVDPAEGAGD